MKNKNTNNTPKILTLPNLLTIARIIGSAVLLLVTPFTAVFYIIYTLTGVTDVLDGFIARKTNTESELGARLDSISDLTFYSCLAIRIFPTLTEVLPDAIWYTLYTVLGIRALSYLCAYLKFGRFAAVHTYLNKLTGLMVFIIAYVITTPAAIPYCWAAVSVAGISSTEELAIHITSKNTPLSENTFSGERTTRPRKDNAMPFDYKKEYKEFYLPSKKPSIVTIPKMNFVAVRGEGDPNAEGGAYKRAIETLYALSFTIKMSKLGDKRIEGYFDYVVPPLEGFWRQHGGGAIDYSDKSGFEWISVIRLPDFVTKTDFDWAVETAQKKKGKDFSAAEFLTLEEGLCVQIMHIGSYDSEPATIALMDDFIAQNGYVNDFSNERRHHEIYLSDPRRAKPEGLKTVIRHPIRKA